MQIVRKYIYTGEFSLEKKSANLTNILKVAHLFKLEELYLQLGNLMGNYISSQNVFGLLTLAKTYNLTQLKRKCLRFIASYPDVCTQYPLNELSHTILVDITRALIKHKIEK